MKKIFIALTLSISCLASTNAQCAMCKAAAESDQKAGGKTAAGLNNGILYMLVMPYLLMATMGVLWWRNRQQVAAYEQEQEVIGLLEK